MSDSRRRRKSNQSGDSDDLSDSYDELNATKETQSSEPTEDHPDSVSEGSYSSNSDTESQDGAQRESGDGQEEEKPQKKLDDDEDRRNPQYIPKRGTFYEHDDRTAEEVADNDVQPQVEREIKEKKVWKDKVEDRWDHDRYNDEEQAPKSHEELIAVYGYDIRNEEGPPRARRRRRYGRGPNKYTRNWEDENAYGKAGNTVSNNKVKKFQKNNEDFPALGGNKNASMPEEAPVLSSAWYNTKKGYKNVKLGPLPGEEDESKAKSKKVPSPKMNENKSPVEPTNSTWKKETRHNQSSNGNNGPDEDSEKLTSRTITRDTNKKNVQESVSLAASRVRGRGFKANTNNNIVANRTPEIKPRGRGRPIINENKSNNMTSHDDDHQLTHDMKHLNVNEGSQYHQSGRFNKNFYTQSPNQQRPNTVPPRLQQQSQQQQQPPQQPQQQQQNIPQQQQQLQDAAGNRPKRYSSLRQRPAIPETAGQQTYPPQHSQHGYFPPQAGNSRNVLDSQGFTQGHFEQNPQVPAQAPPAMSAQPVLPMAPSGQPAGYAPPPFLVPPPQFMQPQTAPPSIINYVPGPNGPPFQPNFQGYQGYNPTVPQAQGPPPQELYQPQGCTYYSPAQQQQQQQQVAPVRRPKAAIPILPPPDNQQQRTRGRGRNNQQSQIIQSDNMQHITQSEIVQPTEQCVATNMIDSEQKPVPGQFDNAESEGLPLQSENLMMENCSNTLEEVTEKISVNVQNLTSIVESPKIVEEVTPIREIDIVQQDTLINENDSVAEKTVDLDITKTENELNKSELKVPEATVVEEAAA